MSGPAPPAGGALNVASAQPAAAANSASSTFKLSKKLGSSLSRFRRDKSMGDTSRADKLRKDIDFTGEHPAGTPRLAACLPAFPVLPACATRRWPRTKLPACQPDSYLSY